MANVQKYTLEALGHMLDHYGRTSDDGVQRSNQEIDSSKTNQNYNLAPRHTVLDRDGCEVELSSMEFIKQRLSEVKHRNLSSYKDNVMCDWVVTLPQGLEDVDTFFKHVYDYMADKYGEKNVISAYVHKDETTPHIHFAFVPVVKDKKSGEEKLCAKELITRIELQQMHPNLQAYLEKHMQQPVAILNGATAGGNITITELKLKKTIEELAAARLETDKLHDAQTAINKAMEVVALVSEEYTKLDTALKTKKWFGSDDRAKLAALENELDNIKRNAAATSQLVSELHTVLSDMNVTKQLDDIFTPLETLEKQANKRIARTERKLQKREKLLAEKENNLENVIQDRVNTELLSYETIIEEKQAEIEMLDKQIDSKQDILSSVNVDYWCDETFFNAVQKNTQAFADVIKSWQEQEKEGDILDLTTSSINKSDIPAR